MVDREPIDHLFDQLSQDSSLRAALDGMDRDFSAVSERLHQQWREKGLNEGFELTVLGPEMERWKKEDLIGGSLSSSAITWNQTGENMFVSRILDHERILGSSEGYASFYQQGDGLSEQPILSPQFSARVQFRAETDEEGNAISMFPIDFRISFGSLGEDELFAAYFNAFGELKSFGVVLTPLDSLREGAITLEERARLIISNIKDIKDVKAAEEQFDRELGEYRASRKLDYVRGYLLEDGMHVLHYQNLDMGFITHDSPIFFDIDYLGFRKDWYEFPMRLKEQRQKEMERQMAEQGFLSFEVDPFAETDFVDNHIQDFTDEVNNYPLLINRSRTVGGRELRVEETDTHFVFKVGSRRSVESDPEMTVMIPKKYDMRGIVETLPASDDRDLISMREIFSTRFSIASYRVDLNNGL